MTEIAARTRDAVGEGARRKADAVRNAGRDLYHFVARRHWRHRRSRRSSTVRKSPFSARSRRRWPPVWDGMANSQPRLILPLSLSYDHRAIDGAAAARFVRHLSELLEICGSRCCSRPQRPRDRRAR